LRTRRPRLYHAGDSADLDLVVRTLAAREPAIPLYAIGFSLGGNVLLKWLGEAGAGSAIRVAAAISTPYDLAAASSFLARGVGRFYGARFMNRLRAKTMDLMTRFPRETAHLDATRIRRLRSLSEFDAAVTAPLHGFPSAADYHARVSCIGYLSRVAVPTLCISSADDPFYPATAVAQARAASSRDVAFEVTRNGGHTGFVAGPWPWRPRYWAEERAMQWLARLSPGPAKLPPAAHPGAG
jgi:predicted alpha/beta-fold hydrolase